MKWWCACVLLAVLPAAADDPDEMLLRSRGILPTQDSLRAYLRTLYPEPGSEELMRRYARELGAEEPVIRDHAARMLMRAGASASAALRESAESEDPEVRRRALILLERAQGLLDPRPMYAAYMTIARQRIPGLAPEILHSLPLAVDGHVRVAGRRALEASATAGDAPLLRRALATGDADIRAGAVRALGRLLGAGASGDLRGALDDANPEVRYAAAVALARLEDPRSLEALLDLLACENAMIRFKSAGALRALSGSRFDYAAYADAAQRAKGIESWRAWHRLENRPVNWAALRGDFIGVRQHVVLASGRKPRSLIIEIDLDGTVHRRFEVAGLTQGVHALRDGSLLLSLQDPRVVLEYDADNAEVWRSRPLPDVPASLQRLVNGRTLVSFPATGAVAEIDKDSRVVWRAAVGAGCYFAERLDSGITCVALYKSKRIVGLDREGNVVESVRTADAPFSARNLPTRHRIVTYPAKGMVVEHERSGIEKRRWTGFTWPSSAYLLPGGDLVVGDRRGVHRVLPDGTRRTICRETGVNWIAYY